MTSSEENPGEFEREDSALDGSQYNYRDIFEQCDSNNDGMICVNELENFISCHGEICSRIPKSIIFKIHHKADKDGDEQLDYHEFYNLITNEKFQDLMKYYMNAYVEFLIPVQRELPAEPPEGTFQLRSRRISDEQDETGKRFYTLYTCVPPPLFIILVSAFEIVYFFADPSGGKDMIYVPTKRNEFWRYLTYIFIHLSTHHLIFNMFIQILLGIPLEMVHKWWRVIIIYFAGGIGGSMLHSIIESSGLAGASGSVYAIMTAHVANVIMNWGQMKLPFLQLIFFGFMAFYDLGYSIYDHYILKIPTDVGIIAHVGGAISGLLVGIYTLRNIRITRLEKYIWWIALTVYILFVGIVIIINIFVL